MSLLEQLLSSGGPEERLQQVLQIQAAQAPEKTSLMDNIGYSASADNPWGIDVSGNIITRHGDTFDADAMRSLIQAAHATGIKPWQYIGGSIRSLAQSAAMLNSNNGLPHAPPGQSMHNYGLAFDQTRTLPPALRQYLLSHGWYNGASWGDPPHWSYGRNG